MPSADRAIFTLPITPEPGDIDELGHVNNAVYVRWIQAVATAHWQTLADPQDLDNLIWVVARHEIDYRRPTLLGEKLIATTWVGEAQGARFDRFVEIASENGNLHVAARTTWALLDRATLRLMRIPAGLIARFAT